MNSIRFLFVVLVAVLLTVSLSEKVLAAPQQFSAEGDYRLGDYDTRADAKKAALAEAKRKIVEQAGVYIESCTEVNNLQVSQDKIKVFAQGVIMIKTERTEFLENGILCRAYVTAAIDTDSLESRLREMIKKIDEDARRQELEKKEVDRKKIERNNVIETNSARYKTLDNKIEPVKLQSNPEPEKNDTPINIASDLEELEIARAKMVVDLSLATAYTAGSEYKIQEVTGIDAEYHDEKGTIANYLRKNAVMEQNYRFAELSSFVEVAGAEKIIDSLNEVDKKKILDAKDRMTWAKIERARAKSYGEIVLKEAGELFKRVENLLIDADDSQKARLRAIRTEAYDAIRLIQALEVRNKAMDDVAKKYEKANKITAKHDNHNPKPYHSLWDKVKRLFK